MVAVQIRTIALLVTLLVMSVACSRPDGPSSSTAELPTAPAETPTSEATAEPTEVAETDPYAIPADPKDIDKAYVDGVLEALMVSIADATRVVARQGEVTQEVKRELRATHREEPGSSIIAVFNESLKGNARRSPFNPNPTPTRITVREVIFADKRCMFVLVLQDTSGLVRQDIEPFPAYYQLEPKNAQEDPNDLNPTPWIIVADAEPRKDGKEYANPCK